MADKKTNFSEWLTAYHTAIRTYINAKNESCVAALCNNYCTKFVR